MAWPPPIARGSPAAGLEAVRARVQPAFASLRAFLETEYLPACPDRVGWSQTGGGQASYAFFARQFTTTTLTPQARSTRSG